MLSYVRAIVRGLAQEKGHSQAVATKMVDPSEDLKIGERVVCESGKLLNLTAKEAIEIIPPNRKPLLARAIVDDVPALLEAVDLQGAKVTRFEEQAAERLARYITMIGPLLLVLGMLALYIEFKTPGFGLPGVTGIVLLAIFFFGHYVAGLAGWEDIVLVLVGLVLLLLEVLVIPGFGLPGIIGLICIVTGLVLAMIPHLPSNVPPLPELEPFSVSSYVQGALLKFVGAAAVVALGIWALSRILPKTPIYGNLVLQTALTQAAGYVSADTEKYRQFLGREGITSSFLRPAGIAMFGDERLDVVSSGDLIPKGTKVRVIQIDGPRVVVEAVPEPPASSGESPV